MTHRLWIIYNDSQSSKKRNIWKKKCEIFVKNTSMLKMKSNESLQSLLWLVTFLKALMLPPVSLRPLVVKIFTWESCQPSTGKNWSRLLLFVYTSFLIRWLTSSHRNLIRPFRTGLVHFRTIRKFDWSNFRRIKTFGKSKFCNERRRESKFSGSEAFREIDNYGVSIFSVFQTLRWIEIFGESKFSKYLTDHKPQKLVQDKPNITYSDIGGLDSQKQEVREAVELPLTHMNMYKSIGIDPPRKHS